MTVNGRIPLSELGTIPGGHLRKDAARAWNDMRDYIGRHHGVWIKPLGSQSSYRTYDQQVYWRNYWCNLGKCGNAAVPGTSNHGWGLAVDVANSTMVSYIRQYGAHFGWKKTEAPQEWWHYNYVGGYNPGPQYYVFKPRLPSVLTKKEAELSNKLRYHRYERAKEARTGHGPRWRKQDRWCKYWYHEIEKQISKISGRLWHRPARRKALRAVLNHNYDWERKRR